MSNPIIDARPELRFESMSCMVQTSCGARMVRQDHLGEATRIEVVLSLCERRAHACLFWRSYSSHASAAGDASLDRSSVSTNSRISSLCIVVSDLCAMEAAISRATSYGAPAFTALTTTFSGMKTSVEPSLLATFLKAFPLSSKLVSGTYTKRTKITVCFQNESLQNGRWSSASVHLSSGGGSSSSYEWISCSLDSAFSIIVAAASLSSTSKTIFL
jgi:hypothetical protein